MAFERHPHLTNVDVMLFYGIWLLVVYAIWAKLSRIPLIIHTLPFKPFTALVGSLVATVLCNLCMLKAISMISVGKSTLVFSTNPMFSMILAAILLSETITKSVIFSTLGAFVGIYFLTINKQNQESEEESIVLGILLVLAGAWFQAAIFVLVRMVSVYRIHYLVRPFYAGITFLIFSGLMMSFNRSSLTFGSYDHIDVLLLSLVGIGA